MSDLLEKAGVDWLEFTIQRGFFYWARDLAEGRFAGPPEVIPWLQPIASAVADGRISSPETLIISDLNQDARRSILRFLNQEYNFLKHADVDALASINEDEINPFLAITKASVLFQELFPKLDIEEVYVFKYLSQRRIGFGFSPDVEPYPKTFNRIPDSEIDLALLNYLELEGEAR